MATIANWRYGTTERERGARRKGRIALGLEEEREVPEYDTKRIAGITQEQMAPALSGLRRQMQRVQARRYGSLLGRKEAIRGGLRGFGEALAPIQATAARTAVGLYDPEYRRELDEWERLRREREREEDREIRRGSFDGGGGETYREALTRMPSIFERGGGPLRLRTPSRELRTVEPEVSPYPEDWMS